MSFRLIASALVVLVLVLLAVVLSPSGAPQEASTAEAPSSQSQPAQQSAPAASPDGDALKSLKIN